jgi:TonB family protein
MKPALRLLVFSVWLWTASLTSSAREIKIIASPGVTADSISMAELKRLFLMQTRTLSDGASVVPVLQRAGWVHETFVRDYLSRDSEEIRVYYQGLVFMGKSSMPKQLDSDAEVVAYIGGADNAIGYVSSAADTDKVKILTVISEKSKDRSLLKRVEPEYPKELQRRGIEGTVRLSLTVSARGSVQSVQVLGGNPILAEAAEKAVREWVYSPSATTSTIEVSIPFAVRP